MDTPSKGLRWRPPEGSKKSRYVEGILNRRILSQLSLVWALVSVEVLPRTVSH
uniref:Uncharacterized protein n=1 Tax=Utricularia reniformis TaxID=192314 RepID=A0A1Y0B2S3_9LAMI|nr:hypothetical protein AEK19_MT1458 [Utricularia reniformis]ART31649.1 hypothetical protein AEK19_MT1458 [Utricularia reniformis]